MKNSDEVDRMSDDEILLACAEEMREKRIPASLLDRITCILRNTPSKSRMRVLERAGLDRSWLKTLLPETELSAKVEFDDVFKMLRIHKGYFDLPKDQKESTHPDDAINLSYEDRRRRVEAAARQEFIILLNFVRDDLAEILPRTASEKNRDVKWAADKAKMLTDALSSNPPNLLDAIGVEQGKVTDADAESENAAFFRNALGVLETLTARLAAGKQPTSRRGKREDIRRIVTLIRVAAFYERWTRKLPTASPEGIFGQFARNVLSLVGASNVEDMSAQFLKIRELRERTGEFVCVFYTYDKIAEFYEKYRSDLIR